MRPVWILCSVLVLGAFVVGLALIDEPPGLHGRSHPEFKTLRQGGDAALRHGPILWLGWAFGCAIILCLSTLVQFGALRGRGRESLGWWLRLATLLYLGIWTWLIFAYRASFGSGPPELYLTLPAPSAIMIFIFWPVSMLFAACFALGFRRWVLTEEEEARFEQLVLENRERGED